MDELFSSFLNCAMPSTSTLLVVIIWSSCILLSISFMKDVVGSWLTLGDFKRFYKYKMLNCNFRIKKCFLPL